MLHAAIYYTYHSKMAATTTAFLVLLAVLLTIFLVCKCDTTGVSEHNDKTVYSRASSGLDSGDDPFNDCGRFRRELCSVPCTAVVCGAPWMYTSLTIYGRNCTEHELDVTLDYIINHMTGQRVYLIYSLAIYDIKLTHFPSSILNVTIDDLHLDNVNLAHTVVNDTQHQSLHVDDSLSLPHNGLKSLPMSMYSTL